MAPKTLSKTAQAIARQPWFPPIGKRFVPQVDKVLYKVSGGRIGMLSAGGLTGLLLTTTGRKTGKERSVPLLYVGHEGRYYLVGSNWGGTTSACRASRPDSWRWATASRVRIRCTRRGTPSPRRRP
jgi:hypothetical protein